MKIVMREFDGMTDGVIDTEVEQEVLMYVIYRIPMPGLTFTFYRSGIGIGTLVTTETARETDIGTMMGIARAVGINPETDGNLEIEIP